MPDELLGVLVMVAIGFVFLLFSVIANPYHKKHHKDERTHAH